MVRARTAAAAVSVLAVTAGLAVGAAGPAAAGPGPVSADLAGSVAPFTAHARVAGEVAGSRRLSVQVWLRPDVAAAQRFAVAVSTPGSPAFRHYVSPDGYAARFGATAAAAARVGSWLRSQGFTGIHADAQRSYVRATARAGLIDAAFGVRLKYYRAAGKVNAGRYRLRSNDRPVSVPARLAGSILGVTGLDNAAPVLAMQRRGRQARPGQPELAAAAAPCSHYYGQHLATGLPRRFGTTTFPTVNCGYSARQLRSVYGITGTHTGAGQTMALVELGLTAGMFRTLQDYAARNGMPAPSPSRYAELPVGRGSACGDPFDEEEQLDVEASYDMAPGMNQIVVGGDSCDRGDFGFQGLFDAETAVLDGTGAKPLASVASNSWGTIFEGQPASVTDIEHAFLVRAAAEGVGMYFSSGDFSGVAPPAADPFAVAVGGTTLGIGRGGHRLFETGWSSGAATEQNHRWGRLVDSGAAAGGPSLLWPQPGYQEGVVPAALSTVGGDRGSGPVRSVPDVGAVADPVTGMAVGLLTFGPHGPPTFSETVIGGTSLATPLVAGMVIDAQQGQRTPFGFLDPALYQLAGTSAFFDPLPLTSQSPTRWRAAFCGTASCGQPLLFAADVQAPTPMLGYTGQVTLPGYDNMTGVGTPAGPAFIAALRALERHP